MICGISGTTPEEPVVSSRTGQVYEKRLIEKYIEANGKEPGTNEILEVKDLIAVKVNKSVKPRPITATSIPSMLQLFQNEWDAMMLESYTLKQHLETVRQELAHALYQHDAACRVIARLIKERDAARSTLSSLSVQLPEGYKPPQAGADAMEVDSGAPIGINENITKKFEEKSKALSKDRKKRQQSPDLATPELLKEYQVVSSNNPHKASAPGILALDLHPTQDDLVVTGGVDAQVLVFNHDSGKIVSTLSGHTKRVNDVLFHPSGEVVLSCSQDKTARIWRSSTSGYTNSHVVKVHTEDVTAISLHATGDYLATASLDRSWGFHDINTGACLLKVTRPRDDAGLSAIAFHPDGLILGTGTTDSMVRIWDVKLQDNVASFEGHTGRIVDIAFSENGFYLATAAEDSIKLWDLRKLANFFTIPLEGTVSAINFDYSGNYLAVAGNQINIFQSGKAFTQIQSYTEHPALVTDVKFGRNASYFASCSMDRSLKIWKKK
jgi:pre-mRNA-processing factor 19